MDLYTKREYAKRHIDSIASHDDAPIGAVEEAIEQLKAYADEQLAEARVRRAAASGIAANS